jgi:hypothetical protein
MIELLVVFLLARKNGRTAGAKGLSPTKYQWGTAGLWFGLEIFGFVFGGILLGPRADVLELYPFGIVSAVSGAIIAYYWAKQAPVSPYAQYVSWGPTHVAPAAGMPGWATPDQTQTPTAMIPPGAELALVERQADWARVRAFNGWTGWVDGRELQPRYDSPVFTDSANT